MVDGEEKTTIFWECQTARIERNDRNGGGRRRNYQRLEEELHKLVIDKRKAEEGRYGKFTENISSGEKKNIQDKRSGGEQRTG